MPEKLRYTLELDFINAGVQFKENVFSSLSVAETGIKGPVI